MPEAPASRMSPSPEEALDLLRIGNQRWVSGHVQHPRQSIERRESLTGSQSPFAVILSCIDSRVPPELVFDCGLGDLLVVRSGAHTLDDIVVGSVEFGPCRLGIPLIVVVGHQGCGAVIAAVEAFQDDRWPSGHTEDVIEALRPAYKMAMQQPGSDLIDKIERAQTVLTVVVLKRQRAFAELLRTNRLSILGGRYDLETGTVDIIA